MSIYRRIYRKNGKKRAVYWFNFWYGGEHYQASTKQGNPNVARTMEATFRTKLAMGELGILEREPAPALKDFSQKFADEISVRCASRPNTVEFYGIKLKRLLEYEPLANAKLDEIDESLIARFIQWRSTQPSRAGHNRKKARKVDAKPISPATINRELATLRRLLHMAHEWKIISRVPKIRLLRGERVREFVFSHEQEREYLEKAEQPLKDAALLMLDTGLRVSELQGLQWSNVHFNPVGNARYGFLHVRRGKSKNAKRNLTLTPRVRAMLETRYAARKSVHVFTDESGTGPVSVYTLESQHGRAKASLNLGKDAVIHSFRHSFGTRLGEAGADAFTIMKIMGHSTVATSMKYVHPTSETMERAFDRLNAANEKARASLPEPQKQIETTTISTTPDDRQLELSEISSL